MYQSEKILVSEECKILWDFPIQTDKQLEHNRPEITVTEKRNKLWQFIDPSCPFDFHTEKKEEEMCTSYNDLSMKKKRI